MLLLLWVSSAGLVATSLLVMVGLVARRAVLVRAGETRAGRRKELTLHLLSAFEGPASELDGLNQVQRDRDLLADIGVEFLELVRGDDRARYAEVLSRLGVDETLLTRARRVSGTRRASAAEALAAFPSPRVVSALHRLLGDRDAETRMSAAIALVEMGRAPKLRDLLDQLGREIGQSRRILQLVEQVARTEPEAALSLALDASAEVVHRLAVIEVLGNLRDQSAARPLAELAQVAEPELGAVCVRALGAIGHPVASGVVAATLDHADWHLRAAAAEAAGRIGIVQTVERLGELLDDPNWWVRFRAGEALMALGRSGRARLTALATGATDRAARTAALILAEGEVVE